MRYMPKVRHDEVVLAGNLHRWVIDWHYEMRPEDLEQWISRV